jgi:CheY-like chemotaxis protein
MHTLESIKPLHKHSVHFYKNDHALVPIVQEYLSEGLGRAGACVVIATPEHCASFQKALTLAGMDVSGAINSRQMLFLDADHTLSLFMTEDGPDPVKFDSAIGSVFHGVSLGGLVKIRAYGEMVDRLWQKGRAAHAVRLEELWNELAERQSFTLMCAYRLQDLSEKVAGLGVQDICGSHSHSTTVEAYGPPEGRVLVAEDDEDDFDEIRAAFGKYYPKVRLENVQNGEEAVRWLHQHRADKPSLVMLDLNMPLKDGRQALGEIRSDRHYDETPLVIFTTSSAKSDERFTDCFRNAFFYTKPTNVANFENLLHSIVLRHLSLSR